MGRTKTLLLIAAAVLAAGQAFAVDNAVTPAQLQGKDWDPNGRWSFNGILRPPHGTCPPTTSCFGTTQRGSIFVCTDGSAQIYCCDLLIGGWHVCGGGAATFNALGSGTNTTAAMHVGTGASLDATAGGTITATAVPFPGVSSGTNTGTLTIGNGGKVALSGTGVLDTDTTQIVRVAKAGAPHSVICGADCTLSTYTCAGGSAMASITDNSATKRYVMEIDPGIYNECVVLKPYVSLLGAGGAAVTWIRPIVTKSTDVRLGAIFWPETAVNVELAGLWVQNDAMNAANGSNGKAITVSDLNQTTTCTNSNCWDGLDIHNNVLVGNEAGLMLHGLRDSTSLTFPHGRVHDNVMIGGQAALQLWDWMDVDVYGNDLWLIPNYCDPASSGVRGGGSKADCGTCNTTQFPVNTADLKSNCLGDPNCQSFWAGRTVEFSGPGCGAANLRASVRSFDNSSGMVTMQPPLATPVDANCIYTFLGVWGATNNSGVGGPGVCTDTDWTTLMVQSDSSTRAGYLVQHANVGNIDADFEGRDRVNFDNNKGHVVYTEGSMGGGDWYCGSRVGMGGWMERGLANRVNVDNYDIQVDLRTDVVNNPNNCTINQVAGFVRTGSVNSNNNENGVSAPPIAFTNSKIRVSNWGDRDVNIYGVLNLADIPASRSWQDPTVYVDNVSIQLEAPKFWAKSYDNSTATYTDITSRAVSFTDAAVAMMPTPFDPNDWFALGVSDWFVTKYAFTLGTVASGGDPSCAWEYSDSSGGWTAIPSRWSLVDGTSCMTASGTLVFTPAPGGLGWQNDMMPTTNKSENLYWIRMRYTGAGPATPPTLKTITTSTGTMQQLATFNNGKLIVGHVASPTPIKTSGTGITWLNGQASVGTLGELVPQWQGTSTALAANDLVCSKAHSENGTATLNKASYYQVATAGAGKKVSLCVYSSDGQMLELSRANVVGDAGLGAENSGALAASGTLPPGDHWLCAGSDGVPTFKTMPTYTVGTGQLLKFASTSSVPTCPTTIDISAATSPTTTATLPEIILVQ